MRALVFIILSWILAFSAGALLRPGQVFLPSLMPGRVESNLSTASVKLAAVTMSENRGSVAFLSVEIRPGRGRVLVNTEPQMELSTQESARLAKLVAERTARVSLSDKDVIFTIRANAPVVGGPSAGAAMAAVTIAAIKGWTIRDDVVITGEIDEGGRVLPVGGVFQKLSALKENGVDTFLIPKGDNIQVVYTQKTVTREPIPGFRIVQTTTVPEYVNIKEYALEQYGISVLEVETIYEAMQELVD